MKTENEFKPRGFTIFQLHNTLTILVVAHKMSKLLLQCAAYLHCTTVSNEASFYMLIPGVTADIFTVNELLCATEVKLVIYCPYLLSHLLQLMVTSFMNM